MEKLYTTVETGLWVQIRVAVETRSDEEVNAQGSSVAGPLIMGVRG